MARHPNGYVVPDLSGKHLRWKLVVDGDDLIVENATATWFGGDSDPQDNGETASGNNTKGHPKLIACSLPMRVDSIKNLRKSPLPHMPFGMFHGYRDNPHGAQINVVNKHTGKPLQHVACIDIGPALYTQHALDLTIAAFAFLLGVDMNDKKAFRAALDKGAQTVDFRILGGAKYLA